MHREPFLKLLAEYAEQFHEEREVTDRFHSFVTTYPGCFERSLEVGHLTGSAFILNGYEDAVLLTHHRKLDRWLQPGGHADGDTDILAVALKEIDEETGLDPIVAVSHGIFDLDVHEIPARKADPAHFHFDVRFLLKHTGNGEFVVSDESHDLAWAKLDCIEDYTDEESIARMVRKVQDRHQF